jgi:hypothetical protein
MNAGAFGGETAEVVEQVTALDPAGGRHELRAAELAFGYRHSALPEGWIATGAVLRCVPGDEKAIRTRMMAIKAEREANQPMHVATGGSTFKNPPGQRAWQLIDAAGCRGLRHGKAVVSDKHCNFLINTGDASAAELEELGEMVRARAGRERYRAQWEIHHQAPDPRPGSWRETYVAVLMGGWSAEREVSLVVVQRRALPARASYLVSKSMSVAICRSASLGPSRMWCTTRAAASADGTVRGCSRSWASYTSGVLASSLAMNKAMAKRLFPVSGCARRMAG